VIVDFDEKEGIVFRKSEKGSQVKVKEEVSA
jgi:hypothetical protein